MTRLGRFRHYKGGTYEVIGVAEHTETGEGFVVYTDDRSGRLWVRPEEDFFEVIDLDGERRPRFEPVGPDEAANVPL